MIIIHHSGTDKLSHRIFTMLHFTDLSKLAKSEVSAHLSSVR